MGFDLETTGVDPFSDLPVSFAFAWFAGGAAGELRRAVVNPGRPIDPAAVAVHGISDARAAAEGLPLGDALARIAGELVGLSDQQVPVVGMNVGYDLTLVDSALRRNGQPGLVERGWRGPVIDVLVIDRHADRWRKGRRNLAALCAHYQVVQVDAHDAAGDAVAAVEVALRIAGRHRWVAAMSPGALHRAQIAWHQTWASRRIERGGDRPFGPWPIGVPPAVAAPAATGHEVLAKRTDGTFRGHDTSAPQPEPELPAVTAAASAWWCEPCHTAFTQIKASCVVCGTKMVPLASPDELPPDAGRRMHPEWARAICRHCGESCVVLAGYDGHPNCDPEASAPPPFPLPSKNPTPPGLHPTPAAAAVTPAA